MLTGPVQRSFRSSSFAPAGRQAWNDDRGRAWSGRTRRKFIQIDSVPARHYSIRGPEGMGRCARDELDRFWAGGAVPPPGSGRSSSVPEEWTPRSTLASPDRIVRVASEDHLCDVLSRSRASPMTVLGGGYSRQRLVHAGTGLLLDVTRMSGLTELGADTATFRAGTRLEVVHAVLRSIGRRMDCSPGVIAMQTLAGAIGTGTHGQGMRQSTLGDAIESVRLVDVEGVPHVVRRGDPEFGALQLHLGVLGVITELEVRTVPWTVHTCEKIAVGEEDFLGGFPEWSERYEFCKAWWFPQQRNGHVWRVREAAPHEQERFHRSGDQLVELTRENRSLNETVLATMDVMERHTRTTDPTRDQFRTVTRFMDFRDVTGDLYELLCKGIPVAQVNLEVALPFERFHRAQEALRRWFDRRRPELHYPVIVRATGASGAWLSPAHGTPSCYYGFVVYRAVDGSLPGDAMSALREAEELLAAEGGKPHWGKHFTPALYDFPRLFERWDDFLAVMRKADPDGRLGSTFTRSLLEQV
ncbi:D-arabinono-1,4-lactone oxidase [Lentzea sp. E54]|uniref:D-arabinono-1,4-lactone oxidase n=1 Tax=Lentzea xerophila TaxID=3435883 RepID=UPI003DA60B19